MNSESHHPYPVDLTTPKRTWGQRLWALVLIAVILAVGLAIARYLLATRPHAKRKPPQKHTTLVETITATPGTEQRIIRGMGRVGAARDIALQARVSGTVAVLHPNFIPGGMVRQGEVLVRLDNIDYTLLLQQKKAALAQAETERSLELGNQRIARQEAKLLAEEGLAIDSDAADLVFRKPQMAGIEANLQRLKAEIAQAQANLERTVIHAPFDAVIMTKEIDIGSQVTPQTVLARLVGIDTFWVEVTIAADDLSWLPEPKRIRAAVFDTAGHRFPARFLRILPDLEEKGLMAKVLLAVDSPMLPGKNGGRLLLGSVVRAELGGRVEHSIFRIPRAALYDSDNLLLVTAANTLHIQPVTIAWQDEQTSYISAGLTARDQVIISSVAAPMENMPVMVNHQGTTAKVEQQ